MPIYADSGQILESQAELKKKHEEHNSYFIRNNFVLSHIKTLPKDFRILELGCAAGGLQKAIMDSGYSNSDFIDIDDYLVYKEIISLNKLKKVDLNKDVLPYPDKSFDIVLAIAIFEHLENPWAFKREIKRVLKGGGQVLLAMPYDFNIFDRMNFFWSGNLSGYTLSNNHITFQTKDLFCKCWRNDFKIKKEIYSPGFIKIFGVKIRMPDNHFMNKLFGTKVLYILEKL